MQIAATNPIALTPDAVPSDVIEQEKQIYKKQLIEQGKPEKIIDNIINGKINKYFQEIVLLEQPFVKENKINIKSLISQKAKEIGDDIKINDFVRVQVGEE